MNKKIQWVLGAAGLILLFFYPKIFGIYFTNVFVTFAIFALYGVSFNMLLGYTGLLSFGHAMFFGFGGYGTALALKHIPGLPLLPAVAIGLLAAAGLALILSPIMVRISGTAFAMIHLAFGQLMYILALKLRSVTGGEDGIGGFPIPPFSIPGLFSVNMKSPENFFYFAMIVLGVSLWILWYFTKTPLGSIQVGIRDNPMRVDYLGFKVPQTKAVVYAFSAGFAGIAGAVLAMFQDLISADGALGIGNSFQPILITLVGGTGSFFGPVWGSAIFAFIEEMTSRYVKHVDLLMGLILIIVIMFFPKGFTGLLALIRDKWAGAPARKDGR